jgi:hypothetical protein
MLRGLKAVSGGGSGGSNNGNGGHTGVNIGHGSSNGNSGFADISVIWWVFIGIVPVLLIILILTARYGYKQCKKARIFDEHATMAKEKVMAHSNETVHKDSEGFIKPKDGVYDVSYADGEPQHIARLAFSDNGEGYNISGEIEDSEGLSKIIQDFVTYDGKAYWKDGKNIKSRFGGLNVSIISEGNFDFEKNTFSGTWQSSTGSSGAYTHFKLADKEQEQQE